MLLHDDFFNFFFNEKCSKLFFIHRSWFLTGLFGGVRRELTTSTLSMSSQIEEADEIVEAKPSVTHIDIKPLDQNKGKEEKSSSNVKAKPTMLREMNFWAPTSY